jgi:hypothetical protein
LVNRRTGSITNGGGLNRFGLNRRRVGANSSDVHSSTAFTGEADPR